MEVSQQTGQETETETATPHTVEFFCAVILHGFEAPTTSTRAEYREKVRERLDRAMELVADSDRHFSELFERCWKAELEQRAFEAQAPAPRHRSWVHKIRDWFW